MMKERKIVQTRSPLASAISFTTSEYFPSKQCRELGRSAYFLNCAAIQQNTPSGHLGQEDRSQKTKRKGQTKSDGIHR